MSEIDDLRKALCELSDTNKQITEAAVEMFRAIEDALATLRDESCSANALYACALTFQHIAEKHGHQFRLGVGVLRHRCLGQDDNHRWTTEYHLTNGRVVTTHYVSEGQPDATYLVLHDRICLAKFGVTEEAFEAYLHRLARK